MSDREFKADVQHRPKITIDYSRLCDVEVDGIDSNDYPDFCDAYICSANYPDRELTEDELEVLNEDASYVYDCVINRLF